MSDERIVEVRIDLPKGDGVTIWRQHLRYRVDELSHDRVMRDVEGAMRRVLTDGKVDSAVMEAMEPRGESVS